jgi:hypothetical protein
LCRLRVIFDVNRDLRRMQQGVVNQAMLHGRLDTFAMFVSD